MKKHIAILLSLFLVFSSCKENETDESMDPKPEIATLAPGGVSLEMATLRGCCFRHDEDFVERGFFFSQDPLDLNALTSGETPENVNKIIDKDVSDGEFTADVFSLKLGVKYYYAAYVKRISGTIRIGSEKNFFPDYLDIQPATKPEAEINVDSYKSAIAQIQTKTFGSENLMGLEASLLRVYDIGIYYWKNGENPEESAVKVSTKLDEEDKKLIKEGDVVDVIISSLKGDTEYYFQPFIQIGVYRSYADYPYVMDEIRGDTGNFTTLPTPLPETQTLQASAITTSGAVLNGKIISDADDMNAEYGFYFSASHEDLLSEANKIKVEKIDEQGFFCQQLTGLIFNMPYYYQTYLKVFAGTADEKIVYGEKESFSTLLLQKPVIHIVPMDYDYRIANITANSAVITCLITEGLDPSLTAMSCGIEYGTDTENLTATTHPEAINEQTGEFVIILQNLQPSTTYYFKPFASNAAGSSDYTDATCFRTPVTAREYLFNASMPIGNFSTRMSLVLPDCVDLIYYELDPIVCDGNTYYLLDRNLNSRAPYTLEDQTAGLSNNSVELWQRVGGLYQWGKEKPSYTWNLPAFTSLIPAPYNWSTPEKVNGTEWPVNPCPAGYEIPTQSDFTNMLKVVSGKNDVSQIRQSEVWKQMRLGPTSNQVNSTGNTNANSSETTLMTADGCVSATADVGVYWITRSGEKTWVTGPATRARNNSFAIRCVRIENKN